MCTSRGFCYCMSPRSSIYSNSLTSYRRRLGNLVATGSATTRPWPHYIKGQSGLWTVRTLYTASSLTLNMTHSCV